MYSWISVAFKMDMQVDNVKKLRELTGAGVMECKKALSETGGDFTKALALIKKRGLAKVDKRSDRTTGAGLIQSYVHNGRIGALLDLRAETDFAVRSEPFKELARELAMQIAAVPAEDVENLLKQPYIRDENLTVGDLIKEVIAKVGENVRVNRFERIEL